MTSKIEELRKKYKKHSEEHKHIFDPDFDCTICKRPLRIKPSMSIGGGMSRHEDCYPGSPTWMKHNKDNKKWYGIFNKGKEEEETICLR